MIWRIFMCLSVLFSLSAALQAESRLIFPRLVLQQGRFSGVAIANPTGSAATLTLRAYRDDGTLFSGSGVVNPRTEIIASGEQYVRLGAQIFSVPASVAEAGRAHLLVDGGQQPDRWPDWFFSGGQQ
ncbi:MAG: hypothetical protein ACR2L2_01460 [Acidobacteriota bacterium]